jgi:hypothetical protein
MGRQTHDENDEIADLERMARQGPAGGGGGDLNSPLYVDGSEGMVFGPDFPPGIYALEVTDIELKQSKGGFDEKTGKTKESIPYLLFTFTCLAGEDPNMVGATIEDRLMAKGKGVTRFKIFAKAVGMWNDEADRFEGRPSDFMGARVWAKIKTEKSVYNGNDRERSVIDFAGYEPIDKYPLPDDGLYEDEDEGVEHEAPAPAPAPVAAAPRVRAAAPVAAPVIEDDVDDLEAGEAEEMDDLGEIEAEPEVQQPVARPRARAAGAAGTQPPWKQ